MRYGKTDIILCQDNDDLGKRAAADVAACMNSLLAEQDEIACVFAAGESQTTFLKALAATPGIDWARIVCFNVDDLWDPNMKETCTCGYQTRTLLYDIVHPKRVELVRWDAEDPYAEAERFAEKLKAASPIDILCQGVGTSGHLALDEPGQASFESDILVKVVDVHEQSKRQLMEDPNFKEQGFIPDKGVTMTVPALMAAKNIFTMVPLALKRPILTQLAATPEPTEALPASILSSVPGKLYVDRDSCPDAWRT